MPTEPPSQIVDRILEDPPVVHPMDSSPDPRMGVWSTEDSCYRLLADRCPPGTRTLETGSGVSTVLFAALGAQHICCTPGSQEVKRIRAHCDQRGIALDSVRFELGSSHESLPRVAADGTTLDIALIDGGHGFPLPAVDWFYAGAMLRRGGLAVLDDINLPAVRLVVGFLDADPRWMAVARTAKWAAWERVSAGPLAEDWTEQPFYVAPGDRVRTNVQRAGRLARRAIGTVRRRLR